MNLFIFVWGIKKQYLVSFFIFFANQSSLSIIIKFWCQNVYLHFLSFFSQICFFLSFLFYFFNLTLFSSNYLIGIFINKRCIICFCSTKCVIMKPKSSSLLPYTTSTSIQKRILSKGVWTNLYLVIGQKMVEVLLRPYCIMMIMKPWNTRSLLKRQVM